MLVPVPERNKPHKVPLQFPTLSAAEAWMHSPEGKDTIADILEDEQGKEPRPDKALPGREAYFLEAPAG